MRSRFREWPPFRLSWRSQKRTKDLPVQTQSLPALTKGQPKKTKEVAPNGGVSQASGGPKGAKRRKKHAEFERAEEVEALAERLAVFEGAFDKATRVAAKGKSSGCASGDYTRPSRSPDCELRDTDAVQHGLRSAAMKDPNCKKSGALVLANAVCSLLKVNPPRRNTPLPLRDEWASLGSGSMDTNATSNPSIETHMHP